MSEKLKPCPFCGKLPYWEEYVNMHPRSYALHCNSLEDDCLERPFTSSYVNKEKAIEEWNTRAKGAHE